MPFYPKAKHPQDAAFEQRGLGTPVQGKADDGQGQPVIRRIAEEIERVGAQAGAANGASIPKTSASRRSWSD